MPAPRSGRHGRPARTAPAKARAGPPTCTRVRSGRAGIASARAARRPWRRPLPLSLPLRHCSVCNLGAAPADESWLRRCPLAVKSAATGSPLPPCRRPLHRPSIAQQHGQTTAAQPSRQRRRVSSSRRCSSSMHAATRSGGALRSARRLARPRLLFVPSRRRRASSYSRRRRALSFPSQQRRRVLAAAAARLVLASGTSCSFLRRPLPRAFAALFPYGAEGCAEGGSQQAPG